MANTKRQAIRKKIANAIPTMSTDILQTIFYIANIAGLIALLTTLLSGGVSLFASWRINENQAAEIRRKDEQLQRDLKDKEAQIVTTQRDAKRIETEAQERIATVEAGAKQDAEKVRAAAEKQIAEVRASAEKEIAALNAAAAKAREGIANANAEAGRANEAAAKANQRAAEEAFKRVELEQTLAPRLLGFTTSELAPLSEFKSVQLEVEYLPEYEARRAAATLAGALEEAGWKLVKFVPRPELEDPFFDGISVQTYHGPQPRDVRSIQAGMALVTFLKDKNWEVRLGPPVSEVGADTVKIWVGFKPSPYFLPEGIKKMLREFEERRRESDRRQKEAEEELKRKREKGILPGMPPKPQEQ